MRNGPKRSGRASSSSVSGLSVQRPKPMKEAPSSAARTRGRHLRRDPAARRGGQRVVEDGGQQDAAHHHPGTAVAGGQREGEQLRLVAHLAGGDQEEAAADGLEGHGALQDGSLVIRWRRSTRAAACAAHVPRRGVGSDGTRALDSGHPPGADVCSAPPRFARRRARHGPARAGGDLPMTPTPTEQLEQTAQANGRWLREAMAPYFFAAMQDEPEAIANLERGLDTPQDQPAPDPGRPAQRADPGRAQHAGLALPHHHPGHRLAPRHLLRHVRPLRPAHAGDGAPRWRSSASSSTARPTPG